METSIWKEKPEDYSCLLSSDDEAVPVKVEDFDHVAIREPEITEMQIQSL